MSTHRTPRRPAIAIATAVALVVGTNAASGGLPASAAPADGETLPREEQLTPAELGDGSVDWLQYGDATEGLSLVGAPEPTSEGSARMSYPLVIPEGRGLTPELSIDYDSGAGNGWAGLGWDIAIGDVAVDTAFGAPHFDPDSESESYLLDGAMLVPNALGDSWEPRVNEDREDYTRQVETEYERIIRHVAAGTNGGPDDYFWEVRDKDGGIRWYGGTLDGGGPDGTIEDPNDPDERIPVLPEIDRGAIVTDEDDNQVRWLLSAVRDVGVNTMTYTYRTLKYEWQGAWVRNDSCAPSDEVLCARHTYPDEIFYTGAAQASTEPADPAYMVKFILETDPDPITGETNPALRTDLTLDASGRYLDLVAERLKYVEVRHGTIPPNPDYDPVTNPDVPKWLPRQLPHNSLATRYTLNYKTGPFDKSLLASVTQGRLAPAESATHEFDYYDSVTDGNNTYDGFADPVDWDTGDPDDFATRPMMDVDAEGSALGMSTNNSAEGHAYIGFNPTIPQKVGSFGGSFQVGGGRTDAVAEWIDLNGDALPDKVFTTTSGVKFRLNQGKPKAGSTKFADPPADISGLARLSGESELSFQISGEAYPVVTVALGLGTTVAWGDAYFLDVNADGLPDFIKGSTIRFNKLNSAGIPTFSEGSAGTFVPIIDGETPTTVDPAIADIQARLAAQSPLVDTVRRWIAPIDGTVEIDAPVTLVGTSVDGVRVSIEHGTDDDVTDIVTPETLAIGQTGFGAVIEEEVAAGDRLYFRVDSRDDGAGDEVTWAPVVRYTDVPGFDDPAGVPLDVNGLSQVEFDSAADFTLTGRPGTSVGMPLGGTVRFSGSIEKTAETTDDLQLMLQRNGTDVSDASDPNNVSVFEVTRTPNGGPETTADEDEVVIPADFVGTIDVEIEFDVDTPPLPDAANPTAHPDQVAAWLDVDSPINLGAVAWHPSLVYVSAFGRDGEPVDTLDENGNPTIFVDLPPEVDHYPMDDLEGISESWSPGDSGEGDALIEILAIGNLPPTDYVFGQAVITVKSAAGRVAKSDPFTPTTGQHTIDLDADFVAGEEYWIDLTFTQTSDLDFRQLNKFDLQSSDPVDPFGQQNVPVTLHWPGNQNYFPLPYRGWATAGYTAAGGLATTTIVESRFDIDPAAVQAPTGLGGPQNVSDVDAQAAEPDPAHAYLPVMAPPALNCQPTQGSTVNTCPPVPLAGEQWQGPRMNLAVSADRMRSSRLGSDSVDIQGLTGAGGGATPGSGTLGALMTRLSVGGPSVSIAAGLGPLGGSVGVGPSFGYQDYQDMNGDGFPDSLRKGLIQYTAQRGGLQSETNHDAPLLDYTSQNFTVSAQGGFTAGLVDIKPNSKSNTNATSNNGGNGTGAPKQAASSGSQSNASDPGLGGSFGIDLGGSANFSWTNPNESEAHDPGGAKAKVGNEMDEIGDKGGEDQPPILEQEFADVNGDGLPDRVVANENGVFVNYNLGYGFAEPAAQIATGGFETQTSSGASATFGFSTPWGEFSGGAALNWDWDRSQYAWIDLDGDGILDKLHQLGTTGSPSVQYGTGSGFGAPKDYGDFAIANDIAGQPQGEQITFDRSDSVGVGFDFTIYVGPLCFPTSLCYLVINPGASYQNSLSATEVTLQDIDGDGFPDSLKSTNDESVSVRLNKAGTTNLLSAVHNPIGGTIGLEYSRDGNTVAYPESIYTMSKVTLDDGRTDADANDLAFAYDYANPKFDRLFRTPLGFDTVTEQQLDAKTGQVKRQTVRTYLNNNAFVAGLETSETLKDAAGQSLRGTEQEWAFRDVRNVPGDFDPLAAVDPVAFADLGTIGDLAAPGALVRSIAPLLVETTEQFYDAAGIVQQGSSVEYVRDGLGAALRTLDKGESENPDDDLLTEVIWSDCNTSSSMDPQCPPQPDRPSPFWSGDLCPTWVHTPAILTESNGKTGGARVLYRRVDGSTDLCNNQSVTHLVESIDGQGAIAVTDLQYDNWGSYNRVVHPEDENGIRYAVQYVYDHDRHSDIAETTEFDFTDDEAQVFLDYEDDTTPVPERTGLTSLAEFDPLAGKVLKRIDGGGLETVYRYDSLARLTHIDNPKAVGVVTYTYAPNAAGYSYATAEHRDATDAANPITTVQFVDGLGRIIQSKRDARVTDAAGQAVDTRIVTGRVVLDELGRTDQEYRPTVDTKAATEFENSPPATPVTTTDWDLLDRETLRVEPSLIKPTGRDTTTVYGFADVGGGITVNAAVETDPRGRVTTDFVDVRGNLLKSDDDPANEAKRTTSYAYDGAGRLLSVADFAGRVTTHEYDLLGQRTETTTPDVGPVEYGYDPAGRLSTETTPNHRENNLDPTHYSYELNRLTEIDYADGTPGVTYEYGDADADGGAGRIVRIEDGSRILTRVYDTLGEVSSETAEMKLHNWTPDTAEPERFQWTTRYSRDALGRLATVTLPDDEKLEFGYDSGGMPQSVRGLEQGLIRVQVGVDPEGNPIFEDQPITRVYDYVLDRGYDEMLRPTASALGNGVLTDWTYETDTTWLSRILVTSPNRNIGTNPVDLKEVQDLNYTYDLVGNPKTYKNDLPADVSSLFGGLVSQTYTYDGYDRLDQSHGDWTQAPGKAHHYDFDLDYDNDGNVKTKTQSYTLNGKTQTDQTYSFNRTFTTDDPHQVAASGTDRYHYDANGNLLGITDRRDRWVRQITWDAADHMVHVSDGNESTEYRYDDLGRLAIERGPGGENAFLNEWVTVRNGNELMKHVWLDDERVATQRDPGDDPFEVEKRYFLHTDLQDSTNLVTDANGDTFQHHEYFPTGEVWVDESSTVFRTPYQYGGAYNDEQRDLIAFGQRWYDTRREFFTASDPVLYDDPSAMLEQPDLRAAYAYAGANALANVDPGGDRFFGVLKNVIRPFKALGSKIGKLIAKARAARVAAAAAKPAAPTAKPSAVKAKPTTKATKVPKTGKTHRKEKPKVFTADTADTVVMNARANARGAAPSWVKRYEANQKLAEASEPNALFEYDMKTKTLKIGGPYTLRDDTGRPRPYFKRAKFTIK